MRRGEKKVVSWMAGCSKVVVMTIVVSLIMFQLIEKLVSELLSSPFDFPLLLLLLLPVSAVTWASQSPPQEDHQDGEGL